MPPAVVPMHALAPHLHFAVSNGRVAFLDVAGDRYFCLPPAAETAFLQALGVLPGAPPEQAVRDLVQDGLLVREGVPRDADSEALPPPQDDLLALRAPSPSLVICSEVLRTTAGTVLEERWRSLERRLQRLRRRSEAADSPDRRRECIEAALLFESARRLIPARRTCLRDTLALAAFLARRKLPYHVVFGVTMEPFAAHCWAQSGTTVLNDDVEHARPFSPILVL